MISRALQRGIYFTSRAILQVDYCEQLRPCDPDFYPPRGLKTRKQTDRLGGYADKSFTWTMKRGLSP
jgi:hypothetical protein